MDDNIISSDNDVEENLIIVNLRSKKQKLNDGSSQDIQNVASSSRVENEDNLDSGISADKSESTNSDDRVSEPTQGPSNELVEVAPSSSFDCTMLLNLRRPRSDRNYRKRKTPGRDMDSNESSEDSDDLSTEETNVESRFQPDEASNSEPDTPYIQQFMPTSSEGSSSVNEHDSEDQSSGNSSSSSDGDMGLDDTDTEDELWSRHNGDDDENKNEIPSVLQKARPKHSYLMLREIINRELGLTFPHGKTVKNDVMFEQAFYGSLHAVYRLERMHLLNKHRGCVNSINFHPEGHLLASGSDDTNVIVWDWSQNRPLQMIKTGHKANVFQSKFLHLNARSQLNIVTCARDGQVRLLQCPPSGGSPVMRRRLATHSRAAHKLHVNASEPHLVISAGEDGVVMQCDVRAEHATRLFQVKERGDCIPLYSINGHPLDHNEMVVAGRDKFVRVYDRRISTKPVALYCPSKFNNSIVTNKKITSSMLHLTCAVYNHDGSEILGSYNDEDIYLFDTKQDLYDKDNTSDRDGFSHSYTGHRNSATFKGVAFFGPKSQYIVSGSDCSYIYVWEKKSEAIVQWLKGDENGVVNCIEAHPRNPVLASSGLDRDIKIWVPKAQDDPKYENIESVVRSNRLSLTSPLFTDFLPTLYYSEWRSGFFSDDESRPNGNGAEFDGNMCTMA